MAARIDREKDIGGRKSGSAATRKSFGRAPTIPPLCVIAVAAFPLASRIRSFMNLATSARAALVVCSLILCTSCAEFEAQMNAGHTVVSNAVKIATGDNLDSGYWNGDGVSGSSKIVVTLSEQRARFYKGSKVVGESTISTGKPGFDTPPGHYTIIQKDEHHVSSEYGDYVSDSGDVVKANVDARKDSRPPGSHFSGAKMPYFMRFRGGYGMHAGYVPKFRASHGCIRMPIGMVQHFFDAAEEGTPVIVRE